MTMWISDPERYRPDRLMLAQKVIKRCRRSASGCFEWHGAHSPKGYGRIRIQRRLLLTHRVVAFAAGMIEDLDPDMDQCILHQCDNPRCCNPDHLAVGTLSDNMQQCVERGRHGSQR